MKYWDYFLAPGVRPLSVLLGVVLGGLSALVGGWQIGVLVGASAAVVLSFLIPLVVYREEAPYTRLKQTLPQPFLFDERVRFTVRGGSVCGYFILTDRSMVFLSLDRGRHQMELAREDVKSLVLGEDYSLSIYLSNTQFIRVQSNTCEDMYRLLQENGWGSNA